MNVEQKLAENMVARETAQQVIELAMDSLVNATKLNPKRYWETIAQYAAEQCDMALTSSACTGACVLEMTDEEARKFEDTKIPFGVHQGERVGSISPHYWTNTRQSSFERELRRYLRSKRFRDIQTDTDD
jgi:hypothetical protein